MRLLVIETATDACSVALFEDARLIGACHEAIGRGHAECLVPMICGLPDKGRADEIRVSLGPGSFTGVRIGLATARALGLAWGCVVRGYPTLALVAAMARNEAAGEVTVCMAGGHGEWFVQDFGVNGWPLNELQSLSPERAAQHDCRTIIAGSKADDLAAMLPHHKTIIVQNILPDARQAVTLPHNLLNDMLSPLYGRKPDAKLPG